MAKKPWTPVPKKKLRLNVEISLQQQQKENVEFHKGDQAIFLINLILT
jgi:hypothetical protein